MKSTESLTVKKLYKLVIGKLLRKVVWINNRRNPRGSDRTAGKVQELYKDYSFKTNSLKISFTGLRFFIYRVDKKKSNIEKNEHQYVDTLLYEIHRYE